MNRFLLTVLLFALVSCNKEPGGSDDRHDWGKLEHYGDFFVEYSSRPTLPRKLKFDFNEAARDSVSAIRLQLVERWVKWNDTTGGSDTTYRVPTEVIMFNGNEKCPGNILTIDPKDGDALISFAFDKTSFHDGDHDYAFMLQLLDNGGLDRINNTDVSVVGGASPIYLTHIWELRKDAVMNPLAEGLTWGGIGLMALLVVVMLVMRAGHPTFKIRELRIEYYTATGELRPPYQKIQIKGCYKVVCANRKPKQSVVSRVFNGKIAVAVNDFWDKEICFVPRSSSKNTIRIAQNPYDAFVKSMAKGEANEFINANNEKAIIQF